jgi:hypothetical protein
MDDSELQKIVQRGEIDRAIVDVERVEGLGAAPYVDADNECHF